jgi:hypothetical protein
MILGIQGGFIIRFVFSRIIKLERFRPSLRAAIFRIIVRGFWVDFLFQMIESRQCTFARLDLQLPGLLLFMLLFQLLLLF